MTKYRLIISVFFLCLAIGVLAQTSPQQVSLVPMADGRTLWLPAGTPEQVQPLVTTYYRHFRNTWASFFGTPPALPETLVVPPSKDLYESLFSTLWQNARDTLPPADRPGALGAMRYVVMNDPSPYVDALARVISTRSLDGGLFRTPLVYLFLLDQVEDPTFLSQALPPGPDGANVQKAIEGRGVSWKAFENRFAAWVLEKGIETHLLSLSKGSLPAVWVLDSDLAPGAFTGWSFAISDVDEGVGYEVAGDAPDGLRLVSFFTGPEGHVTQAGMASLTNGPMRLPKKGDRLWVFVWNASQQPEGTGLTITLWKVYDLPFEIRESDHQNRTLDLLLQEGPGIADYSLWGRLREETPVSPLPLPPFPSKGEGVHRYLLQLPTPLKNVHDLRLFCRMLSGGTYSAPISSSETPAQ